MSHSYVLESLEAASPGDLVELTGAEAHHAAVVSRMRRGEHVRIGNGRGLIADGVIEEAAQHRVAVRVLESVVEAAPRPRIALAQALAKGDRAELAVQAATELGVDVIVPWAAERSIVQWSGPRGERSLERWRAIVREAAKQAMRSRIPEVTEPVTTKQLARMAGDWRILVLEPRAAQPLTSIALDERDVLLVVGPEGGVAPSEHALLEETGADAVRLGPHVLRTSTAGMAAIAALAARMGRW